MRAAGGRSIRGRKPRSAGINAAAGDVSWLLGQLEPIYPGTRAAFTERACEDHWASDPYVHGAYSYLRAGQATSYLRLAAETEGTIHFAGEHTSEENERFLDGGVETGERAAREILGRLRGGSWTPSWRARAPRRV
jgi:monoamine oxidase